MGKRTIVKPAIHDCVKIDIAFENFVATKRAKGLAKDSIGNLEVAYHIFKQNNDVEFVDELNEALFIDWTNRMIDKDLKPSSINTYLCNMRTFVNWCISKDYIKPMKVALIKYQAEVLKVYSEEDLKKLLKAPNKSNFVEYRTWLIVSFILATGARAATLINIKIDDLDLKRGSVVYSHLKNKKAVIIPIPKSLCSMIREFLETWETGSDYLFCDVSSGQLTRNAVRQSFDKYCAKRGVESFGVHKLRNSFAKGWIKNGGGEFQLQQMLCHSDLTMTRRYVQLFSDDLNDDVVKFNPLDTLRQRNTRTKSVMLK